MEQKRQYNRNTQTGSVLYFHRAWLTKDGKALFTRNEIQPETDIPTHIICIGE